MSRELLKKIITAVCAVTNDQTTLQIAKWATMAPNGHAARHLNQYLEGKGDLKVDLMRVLREDRGVQYEVHKEIIFGLREGKAKGTIPISQSVYKNKDWKFAIGSMNINWSFPSTRDKDKVHIGFRNAYRWHPKENRITQCIHQAADRLRAGKAKNYWMEGKSGDFSMVAQIRSQSAEVPSREARRDALEDRPAVFREYRALAGDPYREHELAEGSE